MFFPVFLVRIFKFEGAAAVGGWIGEKDRAGMGAPGHVVFGEFTILFFAPVIVPFVAALMFLFDSPVGGFF